MFSVWTGAACKDMSAGENERAIEAFVDVLRALEARHGLDHRAVTTAAMNLGYALLNDEQAAAALPYLERAARWSAARSEPAEPDDVRAFSAYATALSELGRPQEAKEWLSRASSMTTAAPESGLPRSRARPGAADGR